MLVTLRGRVSHCTSTSFHTRGNHALSMLFNTGMDFTAAARESPGIAWGFKAGNLSEREQQHGVQKGDVVRVIQALRSKEYEIVDASEVSTPPLHCTCLKMCRRNLPRGERCRKVRRTRLGPQDSVEIARLRRRSKGSIASNADRVEPDFPKQRAANIHAFVLRHGHLLRHFMRSSR